MRIRRIAYATIGSVLVLFGACTLGRPRALRWLAQEDATDVATHDAAPGKPSVAATATEEDGREDAATTGRTIDPEALRRDVVALTEGFPHRSYGQPTVLDDAARWLDASLRQTGGRITEQRFTVGGGSYANVIASYGPDGGPRVVVGAHYDAAHSLPGADDNASGVAGLLALARALGDAPPAGRVDLVAYTLEEPPNFATDNMGSVQHAKSLREAGVAVRAMISLEMIGYFDSAEGTQSYPAGGMEDVYGSRGDFIAVVGDLDSRPLIAEVKAAMRRGSDVRVESLSAPRFVRGVDWSDHRSYWAEGYPAVMITDTSFLRNRRYHTDEDVAATLDYTTMAKVVASTLAAVRALAQ
jgi:hypothetical protein